MGGYLEQLINKNHKLFIKMKQVFMSSLTWSTEDFDNIVESMYGDGQDVEVYNVLNSYSDESKVDFVANAIEDVEDRIMEMINQQILYWITIEAKQIKSKK